MTLQSDMTGSAYVLDEADTRPFAAPVGVNERPLVRARSAAADEIRAFEQEIAALTRRRAEHAPPPRRQTMDGEAAICVLLFPCALTGLVALPFLYVATNVWEHADASAPVRTGEEVVREARLDALLVHATQLLQDETAPLSGDRVLEYRIIQAGISGWKSNEWFSGYCLRIAVEFAFLESGRVVWRTPFVLGGVDRSPGSTQTACWEFALDLPKTDEAWRRVLETATYDIAYALKQRTPGWGWETVKQGLGDERDPAPSSQRLIRTAD